MKSNTEDTTHLDDNRFELLKKLLLDEQINEIEILKEEVLRREKFRKKVVPVVDEKIDELKENFPTHFGKTITETIKVQIKESKEEMIEALYPIIGKLIKKYIVEEIAKLNAKINKTIAEQFSIKQIIQRLFKGKKTNADDVLQEVFEATIEEVFVINKDSGLLAGSYSRGNIADKDMISGMLTAIKSFAEDAFHKENQNLEDIKFETFQLSIQNFKTIYIAIATSGVVSIDFKEKLYDNITNLAEIILRDRSYLADEKKLNPLIIEKLIKEEN